MKKERGIVKKVEKYGRIVLPEGYRTRLGPLPGDAVLISVVGDEVIIKRSPEKRRVKTRLLRESKVLSVTAKDRKACLG